MSVGANRPKPRAGDWLYSDKILKDMEQWLEDEVTIDTDHTIPYTAGYSKDRLTIYIDKHVPQFKDFGGTKLKVWVAFALHEIIEKSLEEGPYFAPYQYAHQAALREEKDYIEACGVNWNDYIRWSNKLCDDIYKSEDYSNVPDDLDVTPYVDEDDTKTLKAMGYNTDGDYEE